MNVCENKLQIERKVYIFYSKNLLIDKSFINIISSNYMTHKCGIIIKYYDNGMFWIARNWTFLYFISYNKDRLFNRIIIIKKCFV